MPTAARIVPIAVEDFNVLWANVETLRPAVYMAPPKAAAARRQFDRDPAARLAAQLLERCLQASCELYDFDHTLDQMARDWLLPGRGQAWIVYEPAFYPAAGNRQSAVGSRQSAVGYRQSAGGDATLSNTSIINAASGRQIAGPTVAVAPAAALPGSLSGGSQDEFLRTAQRLVGTSVAPTDGPMQMGSPGIVASAMQAMQQMAGPYAAAEESEEDLAYEQVIADYVPWTDFLHSAGSRTWSEVEWWGAGCCSHGARDARGSERRSMRRL